MSQEQAFLAAMLASPDDLVLHQVFADWLEEQGDPRGELLRLTHALTQEVDCFQLAESEASLQKVLPFCEMHCQQTCRREQKEARLHTLVLQGVAAVGPFWSNELGMHFAWVPRGTFVMGTPQKEVEWIAREDRVYACNHFDLDDESGTFHDRRRHEVTLSRGFFLGTHCVTPKQWTSVIGTDRHGQPMSWTQAVEFCNALSSREGRSLYYKVVEGGAHWDATILGGNGYRLPTEAEWEYACRAGSSAAYCFGNDPEKLGDHAPNKPNAWGLCGMHDDHAPEWCWGMTDNGYHVWRPQGGEVPSSDGPRPVAGRRIGRRAVSGSVFTWLERTSQSPAHRGLDGVGAAGKDAPVPPGASFPRGRSPAMEKDRVTLTSEERVALEHLVSAGKAAARKLTHARVLLWADTHGPRASKSLPGR